MHPSSDQRPNRTRFNRRAAVLPLIAALVLAAPAAWVPRARAASRSFLWKATGRQGVVYLVGSVHLLRKDYYPLSPALDDAYTDSDLLVEEVDMGDMLAPDAQMRLAMRGMLPAGQSLENVVTPATMTLVTRTVADLGMSVEPLKQLKPWMLALYLLGLEWQKAGFDADLGLDKHFYDRAKTDGKRVQALETLEYQIARFDEMTTDQQDHLLFESLNELGTEQASVTALADAWKAGDAPAVERIVLQDVESDQAMYQRLLVDRNRNWLPVVDALLNRPGRAFVVVGAAHLIGPDGLLQMLKAKGYAVEQM
jgi:uncharacterized protein YbaP (TraB family)